MLGAGMSKLWIPYHFKKTQLLPVCNKNLGRFQHVHSHIKKNPSSFSFCCTLEDTNVHTILTAWTIYYQIPLASACNYDKNASMYPSTTLCYPSFWWMVIYCHWQCLICLIHCTFLKRKEYEQSYSSVWKAAKEITFIEEEVKVKRARAVLQVCVRDA